MNTEELKETADALMAGDKGLLAMDESLPTCNKRFKAAGIPQTEEYRRKYRELIVTTPGLAESISGAILFDETIYQSTDDGTLFIDILKKAGIIPGIKVDEGTVEMLGSPKERITNGLDGLDIRLNNYYGLGARFAKWRAVITIGKDLPTEANIQSNTETLAKYARLCQQDDIVPIVEPEVLMDGDHTIERCYEVTQHVIKELFKHLEKEGVYLPGLLLKPNMVIAGKGSHIKNSTGEVATATISCLLASVPPQVAGVAFLSGGQTPQEATRNLYEMHVKYESKLPWPLTFSFARAIQQPALEIWKGKDKNVKAAQDMLRFRASMDSAARAGRYSVDLDKYPVL
jgi:fructose-bisphosphate aldolase class I